MQNFKLKFCKNQSNLFGGAGAVWWRHNIRNWDLNYKINISSSGDKYAAGAIFTVWAGAGSRLGI